MRSLMRHRTVALAGGIMLLAMAAPAEAQAPPSPEASEIASCLCLGQSVDRLRGETTAKQQSYNSIRDELGRLDGQLQRERAAVDVNNPQSVARFRQLLEQRDAVFRRSTGPVVNDVGGTVERYNARVNEYNARCANRPRNPILLNQVQATLSCPAY